VLFRSGNVYVTGYSVGSGSGYDYATVAYSSAGVPLWTNRYNGPGNGDDIGRAVAVDRSGNVYVTGNSVGSGSGNDYATIAYSSGGAPLWTNRYNGPGNSDDYAMALAVDRSGSVYVTGYSYGSGSGNDYATVAYSSSGVPLWTNRYNGPANNSDYASGVAVDGSGNVYVTGGSWGSSGFAGYATVAYSSAGAQLWVNRYNGAGNNNDIAKAVAVDGSGNVYVTGYSYGSRGLPDYATVAYTSAGVPLWTNVFGGGVNTSYYPAAMSADGSGHVYVTGYSAYWTGSYYIRHYTTVAYSSAGAQLWWNSYDGPAGSINDVASAVATDASGNVYVTGNSVGSGSGYDYATVAYSSGGAPLWTNRYSGLDNGDDGASAVAVDGSGNVYVTGYSTGSGSGYDYATLKLLGTDRLLLLYTSPTNFSGTDTFTYVVQDSFGLMATGTVTVIVQGPPQITAQPQDLAVAAGSNCTFSVACSGVAPLAYQWRKDGLPLADSWNLSGSTSNVLTCGAVASTNAGGYDVVVSNIYGSITSRVAMLTVLCPPITVSGAVSPAIAIGQSYSGSFFVSEGGTYAFTVSGALPSGLSLGTPTGNTVPVTGTPNALGTYVFTVTATDSNGCAGGQVFTQAVVCPAFSFTPNALPAAVVGASYSQGISAAYSGHGQSDTILYGLAGGSPPAGLSVAANGTLSGMPAVSGTFNFAIAATNQYGCTGSQAYALNVYTPPGVNPPPTTSLVFGGSGFILTIAGSGSEPLSYQWRLNGTDLADATSSTLAVSLGTMTNAGNYDVFISNPYGSVTSGVVTAAFYGNLNFYAGTTLAGNVGASYRVEYADVIGGVTNAWRTLTNLTLPSSPYLVIDPESPGQNQRFYRAVPSP
jgi:hypothetical protein